MSTNTQDIDEVTNRSLSEKDLQDLFEQRDDIPGKLRGMKRRRTSIESSNAFWVNT